VDGVERVKPLVSVIIPAYNAERFLARALKSVVEQTYAAIEIIVMDDGSKDGTAAVVSSFHDKRIVYRYQENAGQGPARNGGIRTSRGEYITFLDADDYYLPRKIERQVGFLANEKRYQIVYCNALHYYAEKPQRFFKKKGRYYSGNILPELLHTSFINPNTAMMTRSVLDTCGLFNETRYYPEEWELWLRIALSGYEFGYLDEDLVVVEIRKDSNTTTQIQPILKENAIRMIGRVVPGGIEVRGKSYSGQQTIQELKKKLALAYLVNGEREQFLRAFRDAVGLRWTLAGLMMLCVPRSVWMALWRLYQRRRSEYVRNLKSDEIAGPCTAS